MPLDIGLKHIHMAGSGEVLYEVGALNGVSLDYSTGTALIICQTLLHRIVTAPLHERSEDSVVAYCCMSRLHFSLKNVTVPIGRRVARWARVHPAPSERSGPVSRHSAQA
jgi:hypothetical protein